MKALTLALLLALGSLWGCDRALSGELTSMDKTTGCRFQPPGTWKFAVIRWAGPCENNVAEGSGVLRAYEGAKVVEAFYGSIEHGQLVVGVIESDGGFLAGRFENGKHLESQDPQTFIQAFRAASDAATRASEIFRRSGNNASATYYAEKAKVLERQMAD